MFQYLRYIKMKRLTLFANILTPAIALMALIWTIHAYRNASKKNSAQSLYQNTLIKIYNHLESDNYIKLANIKKLPEISESDILLIKDDLKNIILYSKGAYSYDLIKHIDNLSSDTFAYFCIYISDLCRTCQNIIGYNSISVFFGKKKRIYEVSMAIAIMISLVIYIYYVIAYFMGNARLSDSLTVIVIMLFLPSVVWSIFKYF